MFGELPCRQIHTRKDMANLLGGKNTVLVLEGIPALVANLGRRVATVAKMRA
jgi:hypothetical protein